MKIRDKLYKLASRKRINIQIYKDFRNLLTNRIRKAKAKYYEDDFKKTSLNIKKTWSTINSVIRKNKHNSPIEIIDENESKVLDSDVHNTWFVSSHRPTTDCCGHRGTLSSTPAHMDNGENTWCVSSHRPTTDCFGHRGTLCSTPAHMEALNHGTDAFYMLQTLESSKSGGYTTACQYLVCLYLYHLV